MLLSTPELATAVTGHGDIVRPRMSAATWLLPEERRATEHIGDTDLRSAPDLCLNTVVLLLCGMLKPIAGPVSTSSLALIVGVDCVSVVTDTRGGIFVTRCATSGLASTLTKRVTGVPTLLGVMGLRGRSVMPGN